MSTIAKSLKENKNAIDWLVVKMATPIVDCQPRDVDNYILFWVG